MSDSLVAEEAEESARDKPFVPEAIDEEQSGGKFTFQFEEKIRPTPHREHHVSHHGISEKNVNYLCNTHSLTHTCADYFFLFSSVPQRMFAAEMRVASSPTM